jgi:hypothetical protein
MTEDPTQQIQRRPTTEPGPPGPQAPLPGGLDPLRAAPPAGETGGRDIGGRDIGGRDATGVLRLDEIFDTPETPPRQDDWARHDDWAEAPTWTAMPVVPVRSEPMPAAGRPVPLPPSARAGRPARREGPRGQTSRRLRTDAAKAWDGVTREVDAWLRRDDNALMVLTALVACVLIIVVASVGS